MGDIAAEIPMRVGATTRTVILRMLFDLPLTPAQTDDFGIKTPAHYQALKSAIDVATEEITLAEFSLKLDEAMGSGKAITALVNRYAPEYAVEYQTAWDTLKHSQK